ncbi:MAG: sulfurtransferase [Chloroflexi bacterium]|nr:sulfurtransferase [Chloroflexota bacterium]
MTLSHNSSHHSSSLHRWLVIGLAALFALVAVACSSDDGATPDPTAAAGTVQTSTGTGAPADADPSGMDARGYAAGHRLVSAAWLEEHLDDPSIVILDLRNEEGYAAGHIPGARLVIPAANFSRTDEAGVSGQIGTAEQVAAALSAAGVTPDSTVVLYDGANSLWAARTLWVLDVYGHAQTRILDGAWATWTAENRPTSTEAPAVTATTYAFTAAPNNQIIANFEELMEAISDPEALICDARSAEEYAGRDVRSEQGGHVPGAANVDWTTAVNEQSQFKTAEELVAVYEGKVLKGDTNQTVYVYCQTGVRAAHTWFVFHDLLGYENVKNYDGSWQEYGNRADSIIERS